MPSQTNIFDQVVRYLCKQDGDAFFRWLLERDPKLPYAFDGWEDTRRIVIPGQPDRVNDLVAYLRPTVPNLARARAIVEIQTRAIKNIFPRVGVYQLLLTEELAGASGVEVPIRSFLINLTGRNPVRGWKSVLPGMGVRPVVVNLKDESAVELLDRVESGQWGHGLLPWVPLMRGGGEQATIERWKRVALTEPSPERIADYRDSALILAELSKKLVWWKHALEGWMMLESKLVNGWLKQGEDRGTLKSARLALLRVVRVRLANPVPEDLVMAIDGTNDEAILGDWLDAAATSDTIADFRKVMKQT